MKYTLSEAAAATSKNKTTIQRAIKSGKISAPKGLNGSYEIDPSELHRVFPATTQRVAHQEEATQRNAVRHGQKLTDYSALQRIADLEKELAVISAQKDGLDDQKRQLTETVDDLRKRLDASEGRVMVLLSDHRPKGFWARLMGK